MGLFEPQLARKPNHYPETEKFIEAMHDSFWTHKEFNFTSDFAQFKVNLTEQERRVVTRTLSAIGQIEVAVKTFWGKMGDTFNHPGIVDLGYVMADSEVRHNHAYERLLVTLGMEDIFEENLKNPVVKGRVEYLRKYNERRYDDDRMQYIWAITLFTIFVENVSLFSQFYTILHLNRFDNVLKDTAQQVNYTRHEEELHAQVGVYLINKLREEYPDLFTDDLTARIVEECEVAVESECNMIDWMIGDYQAKHLSAPILKAYIKDRINISMSQIGFPLIKVTDEEQKLVDDHCGWMKDESAGLTATDFFYGTPTDYAKGIHSYNWDNYSPVDLFGDKTIEFADGE